MPLSESYAFHKLAFNTSSFDGIDISQIALFFFFFLPHVNQNVEMP